MNQILVNIRQQVNRANIRRESRGGDEFVIIGSATLPDNCVMNGGLYPAEEIEKGYMTLEGRLAPLGHPMDDQGNFIPAASQFAIDNYYVGAANENVRRENGRVLLDKAINVKRAMQTDAGKRLMDRIVALEKGNGEPIHTSTGVFLNRREEEGMTGNGQEYTWVAENMMFDHDAILLDEPGAATPEDGVGIAVNGSQEYQVFHVNCEADQTINSQQDVDESTMWNWLRNKLTLAMGSQPEHNAQKPDNQSQDEQMRNRMIKALGNRYKDGMSDDEIMNAYEDMMKGKAKNGDDKDGMKGNADDVGQPQVNADLQAAVTAALAPMAQKLDAMESKLNANADAEKAELAKTLVDAGMLTEELVKVTPVEAMKHLAANIQQPGAFLGPGYRANGQVDDQYDMSKAEAPE